MYIKMLIPWADDLLYGNYQKAAMVNIDDVPIHEIHIALANATACYHYMKQAIYWIRLRSQVYEHG